MAVAGSAIGLGAIWKFPYVAGTNGGGAFFLVFVLFTVLLGYPLLLGEFIFGRRSQTNAIDAYKQAAPKSVWHLTGYVGVAACFLVLSFLQCCRRVDFALCVKSRYRFFIRAHSGAVRHGVRDGH